MDDKRRQGIIDALHGYEKRQLKKSQGPQRKNKKPEKQVEADILKWAKERGLFLHVVEAKAVWSEKRQSYTSSSVAAGFLDIVGNYKHLALYIELKAPGRKSSLRDNQRRFINNKISQGAFACVVDSVDDLQNLFESWLVTKDLTKRQELLYAHLPKRRAKKDDNGGLFDDFN